MSSISLTARGANGPISTPSKTTPLRTPPAQVTESPGNWSHPRIDEITRRQNATVFTSDHLKTIVYNIAAIVILNFIQKLNVEFGPSQLNSSHAKPYVRWTFLVVQALPLINIVIACLPLVRPKDDLSDIPLTSGQRKLLGLPPSSVPPTPDSAYSTPPRYARSPSMSGSVGKLTPTSSPLSASGSTGSTSRPHGSPYSPVASPLLQKAVGYGGRRSFSQGSQSPLNASLGTSLGASLNSNFNASTSSFNSSIFSEPPATPSPPGGKRVSVGLNNKWLYERSRRNSGNVWS